MTPFLRLKKRCEFLCVYNAQLSAASKTMIIQLYARNDDSYLTRVGFTVSRKVGNAVQRNRARRRLKAVAQEVLPFFPLQGRDVVIVGRPSAVLTPYPLLVKDCQHALSCCLKKEKK